MVTEAPNTSLSAKRETLARIHGRCPRAGRRHKTRILDEFCATSGSHRKSALRLLHRPLTTPACRKRPGPKPTCDPSLLRPVLTVIGLAGDQLCRKLLKAALPHWLEHSQTHQGPLDAAVKEKLLAIRPAQIDRLLRPLRVSLPQKGLSAPQPGTLRPHQVPTRAAPPRPSRGRHRGPLRRHHRR